MEWRGSWVMGLGEVIFFNSLSIAVASRKPTQMGMAFFPSLSARRTTGLCPMASSLTPFTSISIKGGEVSLLMAHRTKEMSRATARPIFQYLFMDFSFVGLFFFSI